MSKNRDVFEDNTVGNNGADGGSPATTYKPGEKPFKDKGKSQGRGFSQVPGAGENPGKLEKGD
jgi:hypothetical protein